jgi:outer membrane protein assembly factor BamD (BamD/ComL family)
MTETWHFRVRRAILLITITTAGAMAPPAQAQQLDPDAAAMMVLDSARRAYNERNYPFAVERFREFLRQYGGHRGAPAAQYGLGLSLLELTPRDNNATLEAFRQASSRQEFAERAFALYYLGATYRAVGAQELDQAAAMPNEAPGHRDNARRDFEEAAKNFAAAAEAFAARLQASAAAAAVAAPALAPAAAPPAPAATPPAGTPAAAAPAVDSADLTQWLIRSRCDHCEMLLRQEKFKEALELVKATLAVKGIEASRFRKLALYHLGHAQFALRDYAAAGRALSRLAPFDQEFGVHACYLLARTHHLSLERPEAAAQYKALLADYEQRKKTAAESLRNAGALAPNERARYEAVVKGPPPEYVLRAAFYAALLLAEEGKFANALEGFAAVLQQSPKGALAEEAQLRVGYCKMQMRDFAEAIKALQPLQDHPQLGDCALWWLARAQVGGADAANPPAYEQALRAAIDTFNRAADRAGQRGGADPEAKLRRGDILVDMADTQQMAKQYREAVATYAKVLSENNNPDRAEEAVERQATALHLAGQFKESDDLCLKFEQTYPNSTLLPAVWFREAENACLAAMAVVNDPSQGSRRGEALRLFETAVKRYDRLLKNFPEFVHANLARYGMGTAHYQLGQYAEAIAALTAIAAPDRGGELAAVSYLLGDCYIRGFPPETEDAMQAGALLDRAEQAAKLLETFLAAQPKGANSPDALLKLGYCYQRMGAVLADPAAQQKMLTQAKEVYERLPRDFNQSPAVAAAAFERAKCLVALGDVNGALSELGRFQADPFKNHPVAPLALVRLSSLLRSQNRATDAVNVMNQCRMQHDGNLANDPTRSDWAVLVQYEQAAAVKESGKLPEARAMFEAIAKQFAARPEGANAQWRAGQCRREEAVATLARSRAIVGKPGVKMEELDAATKAIEDALAALRQTAAFFVAEAAKLDGAPGAARAAGWSASRGAHRRMLYEAAWCYRTLMEAEIEIARQKLQKAALEKVLANLRMRPGSNPPAMLNPPEVPLAAVPVQPGEKAARDQYAALIAGAGETSLAARARLELAEMLAARGENEAALEQLASALESSPPQALAEPIRLRIAACLLAKQDFKSALVQLQPVLRNATSSLLGEARCLAAEAHILAKDWNLAIELLLPFREQDPFRNMNALGDRALLRLGHAFAQAQQWDEARRSYENLTGRFNQSPWFFEAKYGIGWCWQKQNQLDNAVNVYNEVTRGTAAEVAARAQLQVGRCRLAQKRYDEAARELLVVPFAYDYPEHAAAALLDAGQAQLEAKKPAEAAKLWQDLIKDFGASSWAQAAQQRLSEIKR